MTYPSGHDSGFDLDVQYLYDYEVETITELMQRYHLPIIDDTCVNKSSLDKLNVAIRETSDIAEMMLIFIHVAQLAERLDIEPLFEEVLFDSKTVIWFDGLPPEWYTQDKHIDEVLGTCQRIVAAAHSVLQDNTISLHLYLQVFATMHELLQNSLGGV